jgi:hypothetical protein
MIGADVRLFERYLLQGDPTDEQSLHLARDQLQSMVDPEWNARSRSFGESIDVASEASAEHRRRSALLVLRGLSVDGLAGILRLEAQFERRVVTLATKALPDICKFYAIDEKKQTFEKFTALEAVHADVESKLNVMRGMQAQPASFVASRQSVQKALNHSVVRSYLQHYDIIRITQAAHTLFAKFEELQQTQTHEFPILLGEIQSDIAAEIASCDEGPTFFTEQFVRPLFSIARDICRRLDLDSKERFSARITCKGRNPEYLLEKHYPLHEPREISISVPLYNEGRGQALDVTAQISADTEAIATNSQVIRIGDINPGDFVIFFQVMAVEPCTGFNLWIDIKWGQVLSPERFSLELSVPVRAQATDLDWEELSGREPYSLEVAEGEEFVGRQEKVLAVSGRLTRERMVSTYITGQKRIGKSSLALAVRDHIEAADNEGRYRFLVLEKGEYACEDPRETVKMLGDRISEFLLECLDNQARVPPLSFEGTLAPLNRICDLLFQQSPHLRFVVVLDEFDSIHPELYRMGALAETFFSNVRTLSAKRNVAFVLIGGEKMPFIIAAQGDELNKCRCESLTYFSRTDEWPDFCSLVQCPVARQITWHPSALNALFDCTNGHPYYTKLVCGEIFRKAVQERDAEITASEVAVGIARSIASSGSNSFTHLWKDGIGGTREDEEIVSLRRCRILVAIGQVLRINLPITLSNVISQKGYYSLTDSEIAFTLQEFCTRGVLEGENGHYRFTLPFFQEWLKQLGVSSLLVDRVGDELASQLKKEEDLAYVRDTEIVKLTEEWPIYNGKEVSPSLVRAWLQQVDKRREQRLLFKILRKLRFFSDPEIREKLQNAHRAVARQIPPFTQRRPADRRNDILVTYVDGPGKSGAHYASRYAEDNKIAAHCVIEMGDFSKDLAKHEETFDVSVRSVIIVDDVVGTGKSLSENLQKFMQANRECIRLRNPAIRVVVLAATVDGQIKIREKLKTYNGVDIDLIVCEPLTARHFAFVDVKGFESSDEIDEVKALCKTIGSQLVPKAPLGYGDQGLLIVFPNTCPNNSLPLLHASGNYTRENSNSSWRPLFPRPLN